MDVKPFFSHISVTQISFLVPPVLHFRRYLCALDKHFKFSLISHRSNITLKFGKLSFCLYLTDDRCYEVHPMFEVTMFANKISPNLLTNFWFCGSFLNLLISNTSRNYDQEPFDITNGLMFDELPIINQCTNWWYVNWMLLSSYRITI